MKYIGIDLGGTNLKGVAIDRKGDILYKKNIQSRTEEGPEVVIRNIIELIQNITRTVKGDNKTIAIGIAAAGVVDIENGICTWLPNLPGWKDIALVQIIEEKIGTPAYLINDVRAMTLAEKTVGAGQGIKNLVCIAIGTGIGGGIILHDQLYFGDEGFAGEIGHQVINFNGPKCTCGNYGCLEAYASGAHIILEAIRMVKQGATTIIRDLADNDLNKITPKIVALAARKGDEIAKEIWENESFYLGVGLANLVHILNPEMIIVGGGIAEGSDILIDGIRTAVCERLHLGACTDHLQIVQCKLGDIAGAVGAALWSKYSINKVINRRKR